MLSRLTITFIFFRLFLINLSGLGNEYVVSTAEELQKLFRMPVDSISVLLKPGEYHLTPISVIDSTCGNCEDPEIQTEVTAGLILSGRWIKISGPIDQNAVIYTNAGYGIYIHRCETAIIENLVITGGVRNPNGNATDAAIVVKESEAYIHGNKIVDNIGDPEIVSDIIVGIAGIAGRENARLFIYDNEINRNSWDGIALYRKAIAVINRNFIDGVDKAVGQMIGGGRGVGIGITWDAKAFVRNNLITRYWKGVGVFVDAEAELTNNLIEDIVTWGVSLWSAGEGKAGAIIDGNVVYHAGACGVSISISTNTSGGTLRDNIVVETGQNPRYDDPEYYCAQTALAVHSVTETFIIGNNIFYNNRRASEDLPDFDLSKENFFKQLLPKCESLRFHRFAGRSLFIQSFCE